MPQILRQNLALIYRGRDVDEKTQKCGLLVVVVNY